MISINFWLLLWISFFAVVFLLIILFVLISLIYCYIIDKYREYNEKERYKRQPKLELEGMLALEILKQRFHQVDQEYRI